MTYTKAQGTDSTSQPFYSIPIPHEEYAKRLIRAKVGYFAETIPVKDCFDLMLQFSEAEMRIANEYHKIASEALGLQLPKPFLTLLEKDGAL
jgi:hypothetical protein